MAMATKSPPHKHELRPGEVCGHCSRRAPPVKTCGMCRKVVPDWPTDEIGFLESNGWELQEDGFWLEPRERVMRSPTPELVAEAMEQVNFYEAQFKHWAQTLKRDVPKREALQEGAEKARRRLASLRAGERFEGRHRLRMTQVDAVRNDYHKAHPYEHRTQDREMRTYTDEQIAQWEREMRARRGGVLVQSDKDILDERRERTLVAHRSMCVECRQY